MKNALQFLFVAFWLFVSCMPIIFTARYMEKVDVLILIFGYINALFLGVFMAVMCIVNQNARKKQNPPKRVKCG
ncbi:hypothetical protein AWE57_24760, partial [Escherichia coli]|uniref:hypothetical protein n=1 Tax=Escherichia coli TaxID=562 RepID=UPI000750EC2F